MHKDKTNPLGQAEAQAKHKKQHRTHWSRKPEQIRRDTELLRVVGLEFGTVAGTFSTLKPVPPKPEKTKQIVALQLGLFEKEVTK